jgi:hypothetical protein
MKRHTAFITARPGPIAKCVARVTGEQLGRYSPSRLLLEIDVGERLAVGVRYSKLGNHGALTRVTHKGGMISVSDRQLRVVAATADLLPVEARGTFLRRVVVGLRGCGDFSDYNVEQVVRGALDRSVAPCP